MFIDRTNPRNPSADIDSMFIDRWSPRAFEPRPLTQTQIDSLFEAARRIGLEAGLQYVYTGNIPGADGESTVCPKCEKVVIGRRGFRLTENNLENGACRFCRLPISGVWN